MFNCCGVTSFLASLLFVVILVRLFYSLVVKHWNHFSERNLSYDRGFPIFGTLYLTVLGRLSMAESSQKVYNKYSKNKVIGMYEIGGKPSYLIRDPEMIRNITIKDFDSFVNHYFQISENTDPLLGKVLFSMSDQQWRDMRSTLSPLFTGSKMRFMLGLMNDCLDQFNDSVRKTILENSARNGHEFEMLPLLSCLANDMIGSTAFGLKMNTLNDPDNEFYKAGTAIAYVLMSMRTFFCIAFPKIAKWFNLRIISEKHNTFFRDVIRKKVNERMEKKIVRPDMLHLLLLAKEGRLNEQKDREADQDTGFATIAEVMAAKTSEKLKNWTDDDLVAQCIIFFLAGFTGVATSLAFMFYELAANLDVQDRLYEEIRETDERLSGQPVTFETIQKMTYLDMFVSELLRKWPAAVIMDRMVNKQYLLEQNDNKILLQPNEVVWMPVYAIHRDEKYYPNPNKFDPERFSDENKKNIQAGTYTPFGLGPRACIANRFALLQLKITCYKILLSFKVECSERTQVPLRLKAGTNALTAEKGFWNQLKLRK